MSTSVTTLVSELLADPEAGWSVGGWGAVADLNRGPGIAVRVSGQTMHTPGGALRIESTDGLVPVAYERCLRRAGSWRQALALCLPASAATMHDRRVVTALGPDAGAIDAGDRTGELFDLGVGSPVADFCVRASDRQLLSALAAAEGSSVWDTASGLKPALLAFGPPRVVLTHAARAEVSTPIPPPDGRTNPGPHTHLLPKLLASGRTYAAIDPIPAGLVPLATVSIPHPVGDEGFDATRHARFQALMRSHGDADHLAIKDEVTGAVLTGTAPPRRWVTGPGSVARTRAIRVTLRQLAWTDPGAPALSAWREAFGEAG